MAPVIITPKHKVYTLTMSNFMTSVATEISAKTPVIQSQNDAIQAFKT